MESNLGIEPSLDIVYQILLRLPGRAVGRFRYVSKQWSSLISSSLFQEEHYRRSPKNPLYLLVENSHCLCKTTMTTFGKEGALPNQFSRAQDSAVHGMASCRGLICIETCLDRSLTLLVINPSTQEQISLPPPNQIVCTSIGFGYVSSTKEFKVVRFFGHDDHGRPRSLCEVLTLGTSKWRKAESAPCVVSQVSHPPFVQGALHLEPLVDDQYRFDSIAAFDIASETYRMIPLPKCNYSPGVDGWYLKEFGESLCFGFYGKDYRWVSYEPGLELWLLEDYNNKEWIKYTIDLSQISPYINWANIEAYMSNGSLMLEVSMEEPMGEKKHLLVYWDNSQDKILPYTMDGSMANGQSNSKSTILADLRSLLSTLYMESVFGLAHLSYQAPLKVKVFRWLRKGWLPVVPKRQKIGYYSLSYCQLCDFDSEGETQNLIMFLACDLAKTLWDKARYCFSLIGLLTALKLAWASWGQRIKRPFKPIWDVASLFHDVLAHVVGAQLSGSTLFSRKGVEGVDDGNTLTLPSAPGSPRDTLLQ